MKSKPRKPDPELEKDNDESVDVEAKSPAVAAAKKSKMAIIAASSILITVVIYILFFKGAQKEPKLQQVEIPKAPGVARSDSGKSPFEIDQPEKRPDSAELLAKPAIPEIPTLPELPDNMVPKDQQIPNIPNQPQLPGQPGQAGTQPQQLLPGQVVPPQQPAAGQPPIQALLPGQQENSQQQAQQQQAQLANQVQAGSDNNKPAPVENTTQIDPRYAPIIVFSGADTGPASSIGYDKNIINLKESDIDKLQKTEAPVVVTYIADRLHTIAQGKLLTAVLETAINTEIPGSVRAIVSRDVYGEAGNHVLIPRGSRLYGAYTSKVVKGQGRVEIGWKRLIRPDGVDLAITFNASDQFGRSGIPGDIDNKYGSVIANSFLTSMLAVGAVAAAQNLFSNQTQSTTTTNPTLGTSTTTGSATNQAIYDVSKTVTDTVSQIIANTLNVDPVIRVPQGTKITVIVNADLKVPYIASSK